MELFYQIESVEELCESVTTISFHWYTRANTENINKASNHRNNGRRCAYARAGQHGRGLKVKLCRIVGAFYSNGCVVNIKKLITLRIK